MICEGCGQCRGIKYAKGVYTVSCLDNGEFPIHETHLDNFKCDTYSERVIEEPPKDNILIILNCGRDFLIYDKDITCNDDMQRRIQSAENWVEFDGMLFNTNEIAVFSFIGG